jgi:hypothetical protein
VGAAFDDLLLCCTAARLLLSQAPAPAPPEMCAGSTAAARWPRLLVADLDDLRLRGTGASPPEPRSRGGALCTHARSRGETCFD